MCIPQKFGELYVSNSLMYHINYSDIKYSIDRVYVGTIISNNDKSMALHWVIVQYKENQKHVEQIEHLHL